MHAIITATLRNSLAVLLLSLTCIAHAEDDSYVSAMRYVSLDTQADNADSKHFSGTGSFTLGRYMWLQGTVGKLTDDSTDGLGDLNNYGIGTGFKGEHVQFSINFSHYKNDASYKQRDVSAALEWYVERFSVGLDAFHRVTDDSYDEAITDTFPLIGTTTIAAHADETFTGNGFGAHTSVNLTEQLSLSLGGMSYSYDRDITISANVSNAQYPFIAQLLERRLNAALQDNLVNRSGSNVTRNVVPLDSSYHLGLSYLFESASLSAQYLRDKILDSDTVIDTVSLSAAIFAGDHWIVAPQIGQSRSDDSDDVTFGGLSVSYNW